MMPASAVQALNGHDFMGRNVVVNEARPPREGGGRGGGGGGGGGRGGYGGGGGGGGAVVAVVAAEAAVVVAEAAVAAGVIDRVLAAPARGRVWQPGESKPVQPSAVNH